MSPFHDPPAPYDRPLVGWPDDLPPPFVEPPAVAREHWARLEARLQRLDRIRWRQHELNTKLIGLQDELPAAQARDQERLGRALAADEPEPRQEAPRLKAEIVKTRRDSLALNTAISREIGKATRLVEQQRAAWAEDLHRHLADAAASYRAAIVQMEQARAKLVAEVEASAWLARFPNSGPLPPTAHVPANPQVDEPPRTFDAVLADLLRDSEQLPTVGPAPVPISGPFDRHPNQVVVEAVDGTGLRRPEVLVPDTPQNRVKETLARIDYEIERKKAETKGRS